MKIYMMTDLEGVAGVSDFEDRSTDTHDNHHVRMRMQRLLTGEVNAAIDGLYEGGATEVIVNDGHGAGYTLDFENLDPRVQVIHGHERPQWLPLLDESVDATILIGAHAKASSPPATAYHTMSKSVKNWTINGVSLGEMGLQALIAGHFGVPMIFVSGDYYACREIEALIPGIVAVAVKKGLSRRSALSWTHERARRMIKAGVKEALGKIKGIKPFTLKPPLVFRDERYDELWAKEKSKGDVTIIDANTREIRAEDVMDLLGKIYGYDPNYRAKSLMGA
jgi:D-amino peptidase